MRRTSPHGLLYRVQRQLTGDEEFQTIAAFLHESDAAEWAASCRDSYNFTHRVKFGNSVVIQHEARS